MGEVPTCLWVSGGFCAWPVQCSEGTECWFWMKRLPTWILAQMHSSRSRSGRSSGTAQCSPSPIVSTPSWIATASLSYPMARWPSLVALTNCFAKAMGYWLNWQHRLERQAKSACWRLQEPLTSATSMELCQKRTVEQNFEEKVVPSHTFHLPVIMPCPSIVENYIFETLLCVIMIVQMLL